MSYNNPNQPSNQDRMEWALEPFNYTAGGATDDDLGLAVTWNGSSTLNLWTWNGRRLVNTDVRTVYADRHGSPLTVAQANSAAEEWLDDLRGSCPECGTLGSDRYDDPNGCDECAEWADQQN